MERSLYHNDADFVAKVGGSGGRPAYRSIVIGILIIVVGIAALITGVFIQWAVVGIVGFVLMFLGVMVAIAPSRRVGPAPLGQQANKARTPHGAGQAGFMDRLNDRWDKRQDGEH
jgi:Protein of unknown function (DUF3040).